MKFLISLLLILLSFGSFASDYSSTEVKTDVSIELSEMGPGKRKKRKKKRINKKRKRKCKQFGRKIYAG